MTSRPQDIAAEIRKMIDDGRLSLDAVERMTGIEHQSLVSFLEDDHSAASTELLQAETPLMAGDSGRLATLVAQLTEGLQIDDDARVKGILESLVAACGLTPDNLAKLLGVDERTVTSALDDIASMSIEARYVLGIRGSYLIGAINQARR